MDEKPDAVDSRCIVPRRTDKGLYVGYPPRGYPPLHSSFSCGRSLRRASLSLFR